MRNVTMIRKESELISIPVEKAVYCENCETVSTSASKRCGLCGSEQIVDLAPLLTGAEAARGGTDQTRALRKLDARQRRALALFEQSQEVTAKEIAEIFGLKSRAAAELSQRWVEDGFFTVSNPSKKSRRYRLAAVYEALMEGGPF